MQQYELTDVIRAGAALLVDKGVGADDADWISKMAVRAEAMGRATHGLNQIFFLCNNIPDPFDPRRQPKISQDQGAALCIDIEDGIGQLGMKLALEVAPQRASEYGVVQIGVGRTSWLGAPGAFLLDLAEQNLLAQLHAQTSNCKDCAPVGGIDARFSTNPIALAFPTVGDPVLADFSTATMSMGGANRLVAAGATADYPAFLDEHGAATSDPTVIQQGGSLQFMGEGQTAHKGYALSLWCEALVALSGGSCNNPDAPPRQSFFLSVMDPQAFAGREVYLQEIDRFLTHLRSSRTRPGGEGIRLPGERALAALREAEQSGLSLNEDRCRRLGL